MVTFRNSKANYLNNIQTLFDCHYPWLSASLIRGKESLLFSAAVLKSPTIDLGCGNGQFAKLTFKGKFDIGVDMIIPKHIDSSSYLNIVKQDLRKMAFDDRSFNTAISNSVFEHIDGVGNAISETARILKRGGKLHLTVPTQEINRVFWLYRLFGERMFVHKTIAKYHYNLSHINLMSEQKWLELLASRGFKIKKTIKYISPVTMFFVTMFVTIAMLPFPAKRFKCTWGVMTLMGKMGRKIPLIKYLLFLPIKMLWLYSAAKDCSNGCYLYIEAIKE